MYKLFGRVGFGHDEMKTAISNRIRALGKAINETVLAFGSANTEVTAVSAADKQTGATVAIRWVQEVLDLKDKFDEVLEKAFVSDKAFQTTFNGVSKWIISGCSR
jgi:cullin 3